MVSPVNVVFRFRVCETHPTHVAVLASSMSPEKLRSTTDTEPSRLLCRRRERVTGYNPPVRDFWNPTELLAVVHAQHSIRD